MKIAFAKYDFSIPKKAQILTICAFFMYNLESVKKCHLKSGKMIGYDINDLCIFTL